MEEEIPGTLRGGEFHPSAQNALNYIKSLSVHTLCMYQETYASCALSGNRTAEICGETLNRILSGQNISDRYALGLAWSLKVMEEEIARAKV